MKNRITTLMFGLILFGCDPSGDNETTTKQLLVGGASGTELAVDQVFRKNNGSDPGTLDPHRAEGVPASNVLRDLYEGLVSCLLYTSPSPRD